MDSAVWLGLAGIAGTLLGTAIGAGGVLGSARIASRGQADLEEQKARRQVYGACATALLARQEACDALLDAFTEDHFSPDRALAMMRDLDAQRDSVARVVGAVAVEGPEAVADHAQYAAAAIEHLASRLRDWLANVTGGRDRQELIQSQLRYAHDDQRDVREGVEDFADKCRKVLHPAESGRLPRWRRRRIRPLA